MSDTNTLLLEVLQAHVLTILLALGILIAGWIIAVIASGIVRRALNRRQIESQAAGQPPLPLSAHSAGRMVFYATLIGALVVCLNVLAPVFSDIQIRQIMQKGLDNLSGPSGVPLTVNAVENVLRNLLLVVLATAVFYAIIRMIRIVYPRLQMSLTEWKGTRIRALRIQKLELVSAEKLAEALGRLLGIARVIFYVMLVYLYMSIVLSFFPETRGVASQLFLVVSAPIVAILVAFVGYLPNVLFILVIGAVTYYALKLIRSIFRAVEHRTIVFAGFHPDWAVPTFQILRFLVLAFALIIVFPYLPGSSSPAFQGVSVFLGVLLSLGSSSAVANVVAGIVLTYMRPFVEGDRVQIAGYTGDVIEKTLLVTHLRTIKNEDVSIPNSLVLGTQIINFSSSAKSHGLVLHTTITIGYDVPWRQVHELMQAAAGSMTDILASPPPFVLQTSLDDFYVSYELNAYTDRPDRMASIYSELHQNIQDQFNQAGVEIMSPHYSALREGQHTAIPGEYLPSDYTPSPFRVAHEDAPKTGGKPRSKSGS